MILVVSLKQVPRKLPIQAVKRIEESKANLLGVVSNATVKLKYNLNSKYGYGYGYKYGYGYGYATYSQYFESDDLDENQSKKQNLDSETKQPNFLVLVQISNFYKKIKESKKFLDLKNKVKTFIEWIDS